MADYFSDGTGFVTWAPGGGCTALLRAVFEGFAIDPDNGMDAESAYIRRSSEECDPTVESLLESLVSFAETQQVALTDPDTLAAVVADLAAFVGRSEAEAAPIIHRLQDIDLEESLAIDTAVEIAVLLDDGHRLASAWMETAHLCSRPRIDGFGGDGIYASRHGAVTRYSGRAKTLGEALDEAVVSGEWQVAAEPLVRDLLDTVFSAGDDARQHLLRACLEQMAQALPQEGAAAMPAQRAGEAAVA